LKQFVVLQHGSRKVCCSSIYSIVMSQQQPMDPRWGSGSNSTPLAVFCLSVSTF
jgi:hypothetical protein